MKRFALTAGLILVITACAAIRTNGDEPKEYVGEKEKATVSQDEWVIPEGRAQTVYVRPKSLAISPNGGYAVYQGYQQLTAPDGVRPSARKNFASLLNLKTGETKDLLQEVDCTNEIQSVWIREALFSTDGQRLLLSVTQYQQQGGRINSLRIFDLKQGTDETISANDRLEVCSTPKTIYVSQMPRKQTAEIKTYNLDGSSEEVLALCGLVVGVSPDEKTLIAVVNPHNPTVPWEARRESDFSLVAITPEGKLLRTFDCLKEVGDKPVVSPQAKYVAYIARGDKTVNGGPRSSFVKVCNINSEKEHTIAGRQLPIAVTDAGDVITIAEKEKKKGGYVYVANYWSANAQSHPLADDVMAACVSGQRLYYLTNEDGKIVLKYVPLKAEKKGNDAK